MAAQDRKRINLIDGKLEGVADVVVDTQGSVKQIASLAAQDRQQISLIGGRLEGVAGEVIDTQDSVKEIAGQVA